MIKFDIEKKVLTLQDETSCFHLQPVGFFLKSNISAIKDLLSLYDENFTKNESILAAVSYAKEASSRLPETKKATLSRKLASIFPEEKKDIGKELAKIIKDKSCNYFFQYKENVFHLTNGKEILSVLSDEKISVSEAEENTSLDIVRCYRENAFPMNDSFYKLDIKKLKKLIKVYNAIILTEEETIKGTVSRGITEAGFKMILEFAKFVNEKNFLNIEISKRAFKIWTEKACLLVSLYSIKEEEIFSDDDIAPDLESLGFKAWQPDFYVSAFPEFETEEKEAVASEAEAVAEEPATEATEASETVEPASENVSAEEPEKATAASYNNSRIVYKQPVLINKKNQIYLFPASFLPVPFSWYKQQLPASSLLFRQKRFEGTGNYINSPVKVFQVLNMARAGPEINIFPDKKR